MSQLLVTKDPNEPRVAVIRTSDSIQFKGCRRRWDWSSHLRGNMNPLIQADPLWLGSGMHYALEDFHGHQKYGTAAMAIMAYAFAFHKKYPDKVPPEWMELLKLGVEMMEYYPVWLKNRPLLDTYVFNGQPQIEVSIKIPIDIGKLKNWQKIAKHWDQVVYSLTLDRAIVDEDKRVWIMEYKSAKVIKTAHYATDPQVSRYIWAADVVYDEPVAGVIYQQHRKDLPKPARVLLNGTISTAQNQTTTHGLYREALMNLYKDPSKFPEANLALLNEFAKEENEDGDKFIRRDRIHRNCKTSESEAQKILLEVSDMLDPDLSIYPNPTRDCPNFCPFYSPCVSLDDGSDWKYQLEQGFEQRPAEYDEWREKLPDPTTFKGIKL